MFNFKKLKILSHDESESTSSFVGIRNSKSGSLEFILPKGFDKFPKDDFYSIKILFFRMYQTFKQFEETNIAKSTKNNNQNHDKRQINVNGNGYIFKDKDDNDVILYSKISTIENMLKAFSDLSLDVLEKSIGKSSIIDYRKIETYLSKAIYLENDAFYVDELDENINVIHYKSSSLINLFCFIIKELFFELGMPIDSRVRELADYFSKNHLSPDHSLFDEFTFEATTNILKNILHEINQNTSYKDWNYWKIFDAVENFLYGGLNNSTIHEDGLFWGASNFSAIWEDMCNTYAFKNYEVWFADTQITYSGTKMGNYQIDNHNTIYKHEKINEYPFFISFRKKFRFLRPDFVQIINRHDNDIFNSAIKIEIKRKYGNGMINFDVKLVDPEFRELYSRFCHELSYKSHNTSKNQKQPSRSIIKKDTVSFSNYFPRTLSLCKKSLQTRSNIQQKTTPDLARIIDWKYMSASDFTNNNQKVKIDAIKQMCYEFCLSKLKIQGSDKSIDKIESIFVIPTFCTLDSHSEHQELIELHSGIPDIMRDNSIKLYALDFFSAQKAYLENA